MQLQIEDLSFRYSSKVPYLFRHFNLSLDKGQILAVQGSSGSGKSSLLRIIAGLESRASGTITIDGIEYQGQGRFVPTEKRGIGFVFQDYALFPFMSVEKNIAFGLKNKKGEKIQQRIGELIELTHLNGLEKRYPHELSGGQQQRAALARSLAANPAILLLDEPFSSLDADLVAEMRAELKLILKSQLMTTILVTHDAEDARYLADQSLLLHDGSNHDLADQV